MAVGEADRERAAAYVEGRMDPSAELAFEAELAASPALAGLVAACRAADPAELQPVPPPALVREQLMDLARAPQLPIDVHALTWDDYLPGLKVHVVHEDPERGVRGWLVWAQAGFRTVPHRHLGDEIILVLDGELSDTRGRYTSGQICHSRAGSVHSEEIAADQDCLAYVVYYGDLEPVE